MYENVIHIWHDAMDWSIKTDGTQYWYREIDSDQWNAGMPPGMSEDDAALLFGHVLSPSTAL